MSPAIRLLCDGIVGWWLVYLIGKVVLRLEEFFNRKCMNRVRPISPQREAVIKVKLFIARRAVDVY